MNWLRVLVASVLLLSPVVVSAQTQVISRGRPSTTNATATPLTGGSTFTGTWEDTRDYNLVTVSVFANQNSASSGWKLQWSSDATNQDLEDTYTVTASVGQSQTSTTKARYFRVSYVNGGSAQATFRLATTFRQTGGPPGPTAVTTGALTDTQLRASAVPVSGTVTANVGSGTQPVSGTITANAGTGTFTVGDGSGALTVDGTVAATQSGTWTVQPGNTANTTAWKVDGSAVTQPISGTVTANVGTGTQPVSGTITANAGTGTFTVGDGAGALNVIVDSGAVTTTPPANASTNVTQVAGTAVDVNSGLKSAGTMRVVLATDQPALTNKLLVTPDSVALPANQSVNVAQMAGTTTSMNTGVRDAGTQRVTIATNDSVPVTGAFFQATQPVSGTVTTTPPANASTNLTQIVGTAADVNSGVKSAGTLRVVLATDQPALTNKLLVTPDSVALPANQSVNAAQFGGTNVSTGTGAGGAGIPRVTVSNDSNVIVTPPTLTKATQGATGFSTQDLHDAGRTAISFYANNVAAGTTTTETLITLTQSKGTGATSSASTYTITSGKTLRLTAIQVAARGHATATIQSTVFNLRLNTAGACIVSSTPILGGFQAATAAVASAWDRVIIPIPDGYEIAGNGTIALCISAAATYVTNAPTWSVNLIGYEY